MPEVTAHAKYVFLDIVKYSYGRSVEAQADIINNLNRIVTDATASLGVRREDYIFLPTGDGICTAILDPGAPYDIHVEIAQRILERLADHNASATDAMRQFQVRIGLNENVDNLVTDINGQRNVAGAGINTAQRIMSAADGNQIMVGEAVYETLRHREKYMNCFRRFQDVVKHNVTLTVFQYIASFPHLNVEIPSRFRSEPSTAKKLSKNAAYYLAHAIKNRKAIIKKRNHAQSCYSTVVLLALLARDTLELSRSTDVRPYKPQTWGYGLSTFEEQLDFYNGQDFWVISELSEFYADKLGRL